MLVGIVAGAANAALKGLNKVEFRTLVSDLFGRPSLWRSILAAPIVFSAVYAAGGANASDAVISALFAFQNGFFCEAILQEREKNPSAPVG
jgi:hypothetical protein